MTELTVVAIVALITLGPQKLPGVLATLGRYANKLRRMASDMRRQTGIDEILREEGLRGGLNELRGLVRGGAAFPAFAGTASPVRPTAPLAPAPSLDLSREYPPEGPDSYGALADDLLADDSNEPGAEPVASVEPSPALPSEARVDEQDAK